MPASFLAYLMKPNIVLNWKPMIWRFWLTFPPFPRSGVFGE